MVRLREIFECLRKAGLKLRVDKCDRMESAIRKLNPVTCRAVSLETNVHSGYLNELVQYDHLKVCPSDNENTGFPVVFDHFSIFAEAVTCSHQAYDAVIMSRFLLQIWFARHGTPTRMLNAPYLTAEVSNEILRAFQVTKVTSTKHPGINSSNRIAPY